MSYINDRTLFINEVEQRNVNYVDITDDSETAFHVLRIFNIKENRDEELYDLISTFSEVEIRPLRGEKINVTFVKPYDLSKYSVGFNCAPIAGSVIFPNIVRTSSAGVVAMTADCVAKMLRRAQFSDTWKRIFPSMLVSDSASIAVRFRELDKLMNKRIMKKHRFILGFHSLANYTIDTYGQLFLGMFIERYVRVGNLSRNFRLMLFHLVKFIMTENNSDILSYMEAWIVKDICQSCAEKQLLSDWEGEVLYYEGNFCFDDKRLFWISDIHAKYVIDECLKGEDHSSSDDVKINKKNDIYSFKRLEHSRYQLKGKNSSIVINYRNNGKIHTTKMNFHNGICLIRAVNISVRAFRSFFYGFDNTVILREIRNLDTLKSGNTDDMLLNLLMIPTHAPHLRSLCENLVAIFYYMALPKVLTDRIIINKNADFYDVVVGVLTSFDANKFPIIYSIRKSTFGTVIPIDGVKQRLADADRLRLKE